MDQPDVSHFPKTSFLTLLAALLIAVAASSGPPPQSQTDLGRPLRDAGLDHPCSGEIPAAPGSPPPPPASSVDEQGLTVISFNFANSQLGPDQVCPYASSRVHDALHPVRCTLLTSSIKSYLLESPSRSIADGRLGLSLIHI